MRSLTAEKMYDSFPGYEVKSAITEATARIQVKEGQIGWADITKLHLTCFHSEVIVMSNGPRFMDSMISKLRLWPIWKESKHFAVSGACEDSSTSARTDEFCRGLSRDLGQNCEVVKKMWFFNQLCVPGLRAIAASEAALAQLIIISVHHAETLPDGVKSWIDLWLRQRNNHGIVLLALFDPVYQGASSSMKTYLQEVAKRGDMEFLVKSEDSPGRR